MLAQHALVVQGVVRVRLQHLQVLDLAERRFRGIGPARWSLAVVELGIGIGIGIGIRGVYGRVMRVVRRRWIWIIG
jgi:hypothetical protein